MRHSAKSPVKTDLPIYPVSTLRDYVIIDDGHLFLSMRQQWIRFALKDTLILMANTITRQPQVTPPEDHLAARTLGTPIITVDHLIKRYKKAERNAVDDISFTVQPGALFSLLGPNGAGKTTTISILTTTLSATSGNVVMAGHDIARDASAVRREVGIIFQKPSLDLNLTAEENIRFHTALYGIYQFRPSFNFMPKAYQDQVRQLGQVLGIEAELFKPVKTYSGGMKRKLEIVRSLMHQPKVLFLDEPTVGLDPDSRQGLWKYLRQARIENNTTIFLTTHYLEEAEEADDVCVIDKGKIVAHGTPAEIKSSLVEEFLLLDAADRDALRAELSQHDIPFTETPLFKVPVSGPAGVHPILRTITTPLSKVETHIPTLEDAYLAIVRKGEDDGN